MSEKELINKLYYLICKHKTTEEICFELNVDLNDLYELVLKLRRTNDDCNLVNGILSKDPILRKSELFSIAPKNKELVCFVSDIHYGSVFDRPDLMKKIYKLCDYFGIDTIFCCGDLTDGYYPRRASYGKYQKVSKAKDVIEYVANVHPFSRNITFYSIAGNHDRTFVDSDDVEIIKQIAYQRPDIVYLGQDNADVDFAGVKIHLYHGYGKAKKNIDARVQKYYDLFSDGAKPDIVQLGHIHHSFYKQINQTTIIQNAALIDQMPNLDEFGYSCEKSCWFATLEYDSDGNLVRVLPALEDLGHVRKREI